MKAKVTQLTSLPTDLEPLVKDIVKDKALKRYASHRGAYCQCDEASLLVVERFKAKGVEATTLFLTSESHLPYELKDPSNSYRKVSNDYWHMVVLVKGKYVFDFTARQYNPKVAFPVVWEMNGKTRPVKTPMWDTSRWREQWDKHQYQGRRPTLG